MADETNAVNVNEKRQYNKSQDFRGGVTKNGTDIATTDDTFDSDSNTAASGNVTLSSGSATVDTGVSSSETATFLVALGPDTDDSEISASIDANSGGNYEVHLDEINTTVGNPTVEYDIIRVR